MRMRAGRRLREAFTCVLLLAPLAFLPSCRGDSQGDGDLPAVASVSFAPTPPITGPNRMVVQLNDLEGAPLEGAALRVEGTMSHAGMIPVIQEAELRGPGEFVIPVFEFTMGGDWILLLHLTLADGTQGVLERRVRVVSGGPGS